MRCERNRPGGKNDRQEVDSASLHPPHTPTQTLESTKLRASIGPHGGRWRGLLCDHASDGGREQSREKLNCDHSRPARSSPGISVRKANQVKSGTRKKTTSARSFYKEIIINNIF